MYLFLLSFSQLCIVKLNELQDALESFQQAHDLAKILEDEAAESAISKAIRDVNDRIAQGKLIHLNV